ncbi:hypothetical protein Tco_0846930 [Tanacetum coccineum]
MGDEVISTIPKRENDEFIKSSVDDLVPIPRESEVTSVCDALECEHLDTLSTGDREIDFNPSRDIEELEHLLADDPVPVPRVFDEPLGNSDSMCRSSETSDLFKELIVEFVLDDSIPTKIDDRYHDSEGGILYFKQLLNEDSSFDVSPALLPTESSLLVLRLPDPKQICLREVERFDSFFSVTQSGGKTRMMETPSFSFHHISSPRPAAYSPKELMYCYYHPHLILGDGFDPETKNLFVEIPSGESKVHIEVLSVLWGNRLPIPDGSLPLSSRLKGGGNNNNNNKNCGLIKDYWTMSARIPMWQFSKEGP